MKKTLSICLSAVLIAGVAAMAAGCGEDNIINEKEDVQVTLTARERYDNSIDIQPKWSSTETEEGKFEGGTFGDPYILRHDGVYYVYCSSDYFEDHTYKCWKSIDLIHYEYLGEHKLGDDMKYATPYAPEVYYWNGDFYMYASCGGNGHYVFKSKDKTPYGDFEVVTDNLGMGIDGTLFIDDDESMYFLGSGTQGVRIYEMESMTDILVNTGVTLTSDMQGNNYWTEAPTLIKRDGVYFLSYSGVNVQSAAYRVNYQYSETSPVDGYQKPSGNSLLLNTLGDIIGTGHSSVVLGPDLDSWYMPYHSIFLEDFMRSYNLNRIEFSGTRMNTAVGFKGIQVPSMPEFYVGNDGTSYATERTDAFTKEGGVWTSNKQTGSEFSAEYSFSNISTDGSFRLTFGGGYVTINENKIQLYKGEMLAGEGTLKNEFDFTKLHTVRLQVKEGRATVQFDNMKKIDIEVTGLGNGAIGYAGVTDGVQIGATLFSNVSFGSSDAKEAKITDETFYAANYLKGENASVIGENSAVRKIENDDADDRNIYSDATALKLAEGDRAVYAIDVLQDGLYGFESLFSTANDGSVIKLQVDDGDPMYLKLSKPDYSKNQGDYETNLKFTRQLLAEFRLTKGLHTLTVKAEKGDFEAIEHALYKTSEQAPQFENSLSEMVAGAEYLTNFALKDGATYSSGLNNIMIQFGSPTMTDYTVSVEVKLGQLSELSNVGLCVRMRKPAYHKTEAETGFQGYFIALNKIQLSLSLCNYDRVGVATESVQATFDKYYEIKAECKGNKITVYLDGNYMFEYTDPDPYSCGAVGLIGIKAEAYFRNLKIQPN